jgi:hypothetical protein
MFWIKAPPARQLGHRARIDLTHGQPHALGTCSDWAK